MWPKWTDVTRGQFIKNAKSSTSCFEDFTLMFNEQVLRTSHLSRGDLFWMEEFSFWQYRTSHYNSQEMRNTWAPHFWCIWVGTSHSKWNEISKCLVLKMRSPRLRVFNELTAGRHNICQCDPLTSCHLIGSKTNLSSSNWIICSIVHNWTCLTVHVTPLSSDKVRTPWHSVYSKPIKT